MVVSKHSKETTTVATTRNLSWMLSRLEPIIIDLALLSVLISYKKGRMDNRHHDVLKPVDQAAANNIKTGSYSNYSCQPPTLRGRLIE